MITNWFGPNGFYLLDEPEPIILAYPDATIYACSADGVDEVAYEDVEPVRLPRAFLDSRQRFLEHLFSD